MAENQTGRHLLTGADFAVVINELGERVSIPKHWVGTDYQPAGTVLDVEPDGDQADGDQVAPLEEPKAEEPKAGRRNP